MALVAPVEDGKIVQNTTDKADSKNNKTAGGSLDKEAFLQLLVAQMKYQDPLEPTSNTETITQYAQFSQVESLNNMSGSMDLQRASAMVGKEVYVKTTLDSGETKFITGKVDYVNFEGGKPYLYIDEKGYSLDEVVTIADSDYLKAYDMATELVMGINKLPNIGIIDLSDAETVEKLKETYDNMDDYQKSFVAKEKAETLEKYAEKIEELRKIDEENKKREAEKAAAAATAAAEKTADAAEKTAEAAEKAAAAAEKAAEAAEKAAEEAAKAGEAAKGVEESVGKTDASEKAAETGANAQTKEDDKEE